MSGVVIAVIVVIVVFVLILFTFGVSEKFANREGYRPGRGGRWGRWNRWGRWSRRFIPTYWFQPVTTINPYETAIRKYYRCLNNCSAAGGSPAQQLKCAQNCKATYDPTIYAL